MPTRKIRDIDPCKLQPCRDPGHNPPSMMVFQPGEYEHECPSCKNVIRFTVRPTHFLQVEQPRASLQQTAQRPTWADENRHANWEAWGRRGNDKSD